MRLFEHAPSAAKHVMTDFVPDWGRSSTVPSVSYPLDYHDEPLVRLVCTQHNDILSDCRQKLVTREWAAFLSEQKLPLEGVQFVTRTPKPIFEAICRQPSLESLRFKWLATDDLSPIVELKNLKHLYIELGSSLTDLSPLQELRQLETLILGSTKKVTDYTPVGCLKNLKTFAVCSYPTRIPADVMTMTTDAFLSRLPNLSYLDLADVRISQRCFLTEETAKTYEYACFRL